MLRRALGLAAAPLVAAAPASTGNACTLHEATGFDEGAVCEVLGAFARAEGNLHGLVVERAGRLVAEAYRRGPDRPIDVLWGLADPLHGGVAFDPQALHDVRSISKSVVGLLVGVAQAQGLLPSLGTPLLDLYPERPELRGGGREAITLAHLLGMCSGLRWDEGTLPNDETRLYWTGDLPGFVLDRPLTHPPGSRFHYDSGHTALLADLIERAARRPWLECARAWLFEPLGIERWHWATDLRGRPLAFAGLRLAPRDLARIGRLVLDGGRHAGRALVPAAWVDASLAPRLPTDVRLAPSSAPLQYGRQWWCGEALDRQGRLRPWSAGFGNGGQRLYVVPSLDLVVVVTAGAYGDASIAGRVQALFERIVAAATSLGVAASTGAAA